LDQWGLLHNAAAPPPPSPVESVNPMVDITFYPYGATNLRVGEIPVLMDEHWSFPVSYCCSILIFNNGSKENIFNAHL